jgi:hypothetical protein
MSMRIAVSLTTMLALAMAFSGGCGPAESRPPKSEPHSETHGEHDHAGHAGPAETVAHDHSGWWCIEHGVPEAVCALCDSKVAAAFQKKGDWCQEHNRADSQCFLCHPELAAQFAAQYEAKFGHPPPKPQE